MATTGNNFCPLYISYFTYLVISVIFEGNDSRTLNPWTVNRGTIKRGQLIAGQLIAWTHNRSDN